MIKKVIHLLVVSVFVVLSAGCDSSSDAPKPPAPKETTPNPDLGELDKASCEFTASEGDIAPTFAPLRKVVQSHFKKEFDEALVRPILAANAMESIRFAKFANIEFYKVSPISKTSCKIFSFIPSAGSSELSVFNEIQGSRPAGSTILGIYFSPENKSFKGANQNAFILMREDTTRWTLVHEYMHHMFSREVQSIKRDIDLTSGLEKEFEVYDAALDKLKASESNQNLLAVLQSLDKIVAIRLELLKRYTLEEITIETYLVGHYKAGTLRFVPRGELAGARAYINSNVKTARQSDEDLTKFINLAIKYAPQIKLESPELAADAQVVDDNVRAHKAKLSELMSEVSALERKNLYGPADSLKMAGTHQHRAGCSHGADIEKQATASIQKALADAEQVLQ